ncbi:MAG: hypothetical protein Tsb0021_18340 [Chlamydiales bacterium]
MDPNYINLEMNFGFENYTNQVQKKDPRERNDKEDLSPIFQTVVHNESSSDDLCSKDYFVDREIIEISGDETIQHPSFPSIVLNSDESDDSEPNCYLDNEQLWERIYSNFSLSNNSITSRELVRESNVPISKYQIPIHSYKSICNYLEKYMLVEVLSKNYLEIIFKGKDLKQNLMLFFDHLHVYCLGQRSHIFYWASKVELKMHTFKDKDTKKNNHSLRIKINWRELEPSSLKYLNFYKLMIGNKEFCSVDKIYPAM